MQLLLLLATGVEMRAVQQMAAHTAEREWVRNNEHSPQRFWSQYHGFRAAGEVHLVDAFAQQWQSGWRALPCKMSLCLLLWIVSTKCVQPEINPSLLFKLMLLFRLLSVEEWSQLCTSSTWGGWQVLMGSGVGWLGRFPWCCL